MAHIMLSAAHKSSGKTTLSVGLCAALRQRGQRVQPFKKGPDYIDPMWLAQAAGRPCYNLDFNTQGEGEIQRLFAHHDEQADLSLIEGNMALFDSLDVEGRHSNAALAELLGAPVVLVVDVRGMTRSVVPLLLGYQRFDPQIRLAGVILNMVGGSRHEQRLRSAIEHYTDLPVVGAIHRDSRLNLHERHLGLVPSNEAEAAQGRIDTIAEVVAKQLDLGQLRAIAGHAQAPTVAPIPPREPKRAADLRIGIAQDAAFGFYYPEDLHGLAHAGAQLVPFNTLEDPCLPEVDGLFIGGGFPETQAAALAANTSLHQAIAEAIAADLPVYAECGGLMYLCRSLTWEGQRYPMVGVIPADVVLHERPVGRGYMTLSETAAFPWPAESDTPAAEATFNAHEFHYSSLENLEGEPRFAYQVIRGAGIDGAHDGLVHRNLLANYAHLRDVEGRHWSRRFVAFVRQQRALRQSSPGDLT